MKQQNKGFYRFEDFQIDAENRQLRRNFEPISLSAKAFDLLVALVENSGRLMEKDELFTSVWQDQIVEESNLSVYISQIRKALGESTKTPRFIETVPGYGYRFVGDVSNSSDEEFVVETQSISRLTIEREHVKSVDDPPMISPPINVGVGGFAKKFRSRSAIFFLGIGAILIFTIGFFAYRLYTFDVHTRNNTQSGLNLETKIKQLTTKGAVGLAAIAPSGKFYAYSLNEPGIYKQSLWFAQADGSNEIQLRPPVGNYQGMAFSRDGNTLYFSINSAESGQNGLFKIPVLGGVAEKLAVNVETSFAISPDESSIAFVRQKKEEKQSVLMISGLDGSNLREIASRSAERNFSTRPAWAPDGTEIALAAVDDPVSDASELYVVRVSDGKVEKITNQHWKGIHNVVWLAGQKSLVAVAVDKNESARHLWQISRVDGTTKRLSLDTDSYGAALSVSSDGKSLAAVQIKRESNFWVAPSDDLSKAQQTTFSSINGIYGWFGFDYLSNDGMVFTAGIDRSLALNTANAVGSDIRQITSAGYFDERPSASADGKNIVFQSNRSGTTDIWMVNRDGANLHQLTSDGRNITPHISPDGSFIVYVKSGSGVNEIRRLPLEGGASSKIFEGYVSNPRISPDGKYVACAFAPDNNSSRKLAIFDLENGNPVKSFDVPATWNINDGIRWTPDGKSICYRDGANGIWRQELSAESPQKIKDIPEEEILKFEWSRDGKRFAFVRGRSISDVVMINLPE